MEITNEAVEAAKLAVHQSLASDWMQVARALGGTQARYEALLDDLTNRVLTAALPHLRPRTVPNTVGALLAVPVGAVLLGVDIAGGLTVMTLAPDTLNWLSIGASYEEETGDMYKHGVEWGIPEWIVVWEGGEDE